MMELLLPLTAFVYAAFLLLRTGYQFLLEEKTSHQLISMGLILWAVHYLVAAVFVYYTIYITFYWVIPEFLALVGALLLVLGFVSGMDTGFFPTSMPSMVAACGTNCALCVEFNSKRCRGCTVMNTQGLGDCPVFHCVKEKGFESCLDCNERTVCEKYAAILLSCPLNESFKPVPRASAISGFMGSSALIRYTPKEKLETGVIEIILRYINEDKNVVLASTNPRTTFYLKKLKKLMDVGGIKIVNMVREGKEEAGNEDVLDIPLANLNRLLAFLYGVPRGTVFIFEPLSQLILNSGKQRAFEYIVTVSDALSRRGIDFIAFMNREAHKYSVEAAFEGLFINLAEISEDKIRNTKGREGEFIHIRGAQEELIENVAQRLASGQRRQGAGAPKGVAERVEEFFGGET
ncbi:MAG: DUF3795 domain-containing protein [Euryarchaeota archaeon]|nr:DUF3795 domain-containing protein [Euryarchaeota archaeon]